ncbi:MAG: IclR family transcriptional regulator [Blastopirellula sp.]|nr:MAG: IclR family transcriptional regulator [Blastopirellula sp.]
MDGSMEMVKNTEKDDDRLFVSSVDKAFKVLEAFGTDRRDLGLVEIIERTGLNKSAAQRFTHTLHRLGYLEKDMSSRRYMLSHRVLESANSFLRVDPLVNKAIPHIVELRRQLNVRIGLGCLHGLNVMYLIPLQSNQAAFRTAHPGFQIPLYCTTTGRVLLAYRKPEEARAIIERCERTKITPTTITDTDAIMTEINNVRNQGYCITDQEIRIGDINLAAPVFDGRGNAIAAVAAACLRNEFSRKDMETKVAPLVIETARAISTDG